MVCKHTCHISWTISHINLLYIMVVLSLNSVSVPPSVGVAVAQHCIDINTSILHWLAVMHCRLLHCHHIRAVDFTDPATSLYISQVGVLV